MLGTDYAGVLVRDGWAPYRCYDGLHQTCLNHLLQRCKHLREDHPDNPWAGEVQAVLQAGLDLRERRSATLPSMSTRIAVPQRLSEALKSVFVIGLGIVLVATQARRRLPWSFGTCPEA